MDEITILRKIVKKMIMEKRVPLDPVVINRELPNEAKNIGVSVDEFRAAIGPIVDEIFQDAQKAYNLGMLDVNPLKK